VARCIHCRKVFVVNLEVSEYAVLLIFDASMLLIGNAAAAHAQAMYRVLTKQVSSVECTSPSSDRSSCDVLEKRVNLILI
jgi:hypothetical protein